MQQKPPRWNISPALVAPEAIDLWKGVAFVAPVWGHAGKGALLNSAGQPLAGANLVAGSGVQWRGTPYGLGVGHNNTSGVLWQAGISPVKTSDGAGTGDFTVVSLLNPIAESRVSLGFNQVSLGGGYPLLRMWFNANTSEAAESGRFTVRTYNSAATDVSASGVIDGKYHLYSVTRTGSDLAIWVDAGKVATTTGTIRNIYGPSAWEYAIGHLASDTTYGRIDVNCNLGLVVAWDRALNAAEMYMLARDPFIMFRPQAEWRGVWTAAGGADVRNHIIPAYMRIAA